MDDAEDSANAVEREGDGEGEGERGGEDDVTLT